MIFAYCRISTNKETQKTDRQKLAILEYAKANDFTIDEIVEEIKSGKDLDRPKYQTLRNKLRKGDVIIVSDIDRLGRDAAQVIIECQYYKKQGIKIVALDIPFLNDWHNINDDSIYQMIIDILITLKAHLAQQEREKLVSRINQGLDVARANGTQLGRPKKIIDKEIMKVYHRVKSGELKKIEASKILNISRQHLDRLIAKIENN